MMLKETSQADWNLEYEYIRWKYPKILVKQGGNYWRHKGKACGLHILSFFFLLFLFPWRFEWRTTDAVRGTAASAAPEQSNCLSFQFLFLSLSLNSFLSFYSPVFSFPSLSLSLCMCRFKLLLFFKKKRRKITEMTLHFKNSVFLSSLESIGQRGG